MEMNKMKSIFTKLDEINYVILHHHEEIFGHNLTPEQALVLEHLNIHSKLSVNELSSKMKVTPGAISQLLAELEQQQYIVRSINPESRREIIVTLGEKGTNLYQAFEKIDQKIVEWEEDLKSEICPFIEESFGETTDFFVYFASHNIGLESDIDPLKPKSYKESEVAPIICITVPRKKSDDDEKILNELIASLKSEDKLKHGSFAMSYIDEKGVILDDEWHKDF